jgi:hypothetical protein
VDREADLLGGFQIYDEFKLRRLLRVGWKAKSQEQSTDRKTTDFFSHRQLPRGNWSTELPE